MDKPIYLIVSSFFPGPGNWRCAFAYDYVKAIQRDGRYRPVVFKPGPSYEYNGIVVHGFSSLSLPSGIPCPLLTPLNVRLFLKAFKSAGFKASDIAVAEAYTNGRVPHLLALKKQNPKILVGVHHHDPASYGVFDGRFRQFWPFKLISYYMRRIPYEKADLHIFISRVVRDSFLAFPKTNWTSYREYARLGRGIQFLRSVRIKGEYILHNGVDTSIFMPKNNQQKRVGASFVIGCIGNFSDWKNQIQLLRAVNRLKARIADLKCVFVGSGRELEACQSYVAENGLGDVVEFRPEVKHEELAEFYRGLDLFCLPSYFEGFGCVFTEANACGVPFITCEGQGMDDLVPEDERGLWLCKFGDEEDLARKIMNVYEHPRCQKLRSPIAILELMRNYLDYVGELRSHNV